MATSILKQLTKDLEDTKKLAGIPVTIGADVLEHLIQLGHRARSLSRVDEIILLTAYNGLMEAKYG